MDEVIIPLKEKYLVRKVNKQGRPNPGSAVNGRMAGMAPKHRKTKKTIRPRKRSYGPF